MTEERIRVALADDDVLLREGLASLLERSGFEVAGQCGDAAQLVDLVRRERPGLVIVDIRMPPHHSTEGLDASHQIRSEFPDTAILVLSAHVDVEHAVDLLASGQRSGYLLKSRIVNVDDFIETLRRLVRGGSVVDPVLVQELVSARRVDDPLEVLSPREREVLALMAEGRSNSAISRELWVTEGTVEKHVRSILMKLHLPESDEVHRRVLAVLTFLEARLRGRADRAAGLASPRPPLAAPLAPLVTPQCCSLRLARERPGSSLPDPAPYPRDLWLPRICRIFVADSSIFGRNPAAEVSVTRSA